MSYSLVNFLSLLVFFPFRITSTLTTCKNVGKSKPGIGAGIGEGQRRITPELGN
jgi:hypothetical protein